MRLNITTKHEIRKGLIAVLVAILIIPMMAMVVFSVDYGYLLVKQSHLQKAADAAALASVRELVPDAYGNQSEYNTRLAARLYSATNNPEIENFMILNNEIEVGQYDPSVIYLSLVILDNGIMDTVRVKLRRDNVANTSVSLFFGPVIGIDKADLNVKSAAILQKGNRIKPGNDVLPFTIPEEVWDSKTMGDVWSIYGDGKMKDSYGNQIPGNWGTVDIGPSSNGTSELTEQILNGLSQNDLNALQLEGRNPNNEYIDSGQPMWLNGEPGLSSGIKSAVQAIHGETRIVPIYDSTNEDAEGANLEFNVVRWGIVEVVHSSWHGNHKTHVTIKKTYTYDAKIEPQKDLSNTVGLIEGAFTVPALVE